MSKFLSSLLVLFVALNFVACAGDNNKGEKPSKDSGLPVYSKTEYFSDYNEITQKELDLEDVGLRFEEIRGHNLETVDYKWDMDFLNAFLDRNVNTSLKKDAVAALEAYVKVTSSFLKKYGRKFEFDGEDQKTLTLVESTKKTLVKKVNLAKVTIKEINEI